MRRPSAQQPVRLSTNCRWRVWDGESVLHDTRSGATHYLNAFSTRVLLCVEEGIIETDAITCRLRAELGLRAWVATRSDVDRALAELKGAAILVDAEPGAHAPWL